MQQFNDGEPLNIVNVNGKDYWIDRPCDFYEISFARVPRET